MRLNELLTPLLEAPKLGVPTQAHRITAPNINIAGRKSYSDQEQAAYDRYREFKQLASDRERFDMLYKMALTNHKISIEGYTLVSYDRATGVITLKNTGGDTFTTSVNDLEYQGRQRGITNSFRYMFKPGSVELVVARTSKHRGPNRATTGKLDTSHLSRGLW